MKPHLLVSDKKGRIYEHPSLEACGMKACLYFRIKPQELIKLPLGSRLFMLSERIPIGYDSKDNNFLSLEGTFAVAGFTPPGYTATFSSAYEESGKTKMLPLFSYAAVASYKGSLYAAAVRIDKDPRHDCRFINIERVKKSADKLKKELPKNRLIKHLAECALSHGCPGAQNFFLGKHEGPLPTSPRCNALCLGCISYQPKKSCPAAQPRIKFVPTPEEVSEIALLHLANVPNAVVSFGQGCDGEPLLVGQMIEKAVKLIRKSTSGGIINMNTNGSRPDILSRLFDAGLGSIRVSLNSSREKYYERYYKPKRYAFKDVVHSIKIAKSKNVFVSINYLTMPGFTDSADEFAVFKKFIGDYKIDMIQWRNLNFDPVLYFKGLRVKTDRSQLMGIREVINSLRKSFPRLLMGYFNPALSTIRKNALKKGRG